MVAAKAAVVVVEIVVVEIVVVEEVESCVPGADVDVKDGVV